MSNFCWRKLSGPHQIGCRFPRQKAGFIVILLYTPLECHRPQQFGRPRDYCGATCCADAALQIGLDPPLFAVPVRHDLA